MVVAGALAEGDPAVGVDGERRGVVCSGHAVGDEGRDRVRGARVVGREGRPAGAVQGDGDDVVETDPGMVEAAAVGAEGSGAHGAVPVAPARPLTRAPPPPLHQPLLS